MRSNLPVTDTGYSVADDVLIEITAQIAAAQGGTQASVEAITEIRATIVERDEIAGAQ